MQVQLDKKTASQSTRELQAELDSLLEAYSKGNVLHCELEWTKRRMSLLATIILRRQGHKGV
jgi:hypothetical protein